MTSKHKGYNINNHPYLLVIVACALLLLAVACGQGSPTTPVHVANGSPTTTTTTPTTSSGNTSPPSGKPGTPASGEVSTVSMPPTQTNCPQPSTGRPAVMRPLALGSHANIAYIFNEGTQFPVPTFGELKRYDVTSGNKTVIVHQPNTTISSAQVSGDGQWLLFVSDIAEADAGVGGSHLQLVRMDGQGLQTLFCAPLFSLEDVQWSPDQKFVIFSRLFSPEEQQIYLLNLATGAVQREFSSTDTNFSYFPRTWLDNTRIYLEKAPIHTQYYQGLYILDTKKGAEQHENDLLPVIQLAQPELCWDFDSDYAATKLITGQCSATFFDGAESGIRQVGPSNIAVQSITGSSAHTTYTNSKYAITQVRMLGYTSNSLLLIIENQSPRNGPTIDTSENGLWKMNTDGSGFTRLTTESPGNQSNFNSYTQYPWSNVSFDGTMYALQVTNTSGNDPITNLYYGPLSGGLPTSFAFAHVNSELVEVAGWTLM